MWVVWIKNIFGQWLEVAFQSNPWKSEEFQVQYLWIHSKSVWFCRGEVHIRGVHEKMKKSQCDLCGYTACEVSAVRSHIKSLHNKLNFKCDWCDYQASQATHMRIHVTAVHKKIKNFKCDLCVYAASQYTTLKSYVKAVHAKDKNFKCDLCVYAASQYTTLKSQVF